MFKTNRKIGYKINQALTTLSQDAEDYFTQSWSEEVVGYRYEDGSTVLHRASQIVSPLERLVEVCSRFSKLKGINIISAAKNNDGHTFLHLIKDDITKNIVKGVLFGPEIVSENLVSNIILCMQKFIYNTSSKDNNTLVMWPIPIFEFQDICTKLSEEGGKAVLSEKASNPIKHTVHDVFAGYIKCTIENNTLFGFKNNVVLSKAMSIVLANKVNMDNGIQGKHGTLITINLNNTETSDTNNIIEALKAKYDIARSITVLKLSERSTQDRGDNQVCMSYMQTETDHHRDATLCKSTNITVNRLPTGELPGPASNISRLSSDVGIIDSSSEEYTANDLYENIRFASLDEFIRACNIDNVGISCCIGEAV
ncbi:Uncharacterised protein [Orientia tsutsugamushi]|uniref:Uncharacterized protein n=1 Tax=Orientia tsutsugamushi TaxID=784 RepID=A0A2R8F232_ORITS|nr:hypothetical protein [Orientia tsutsugamushi]SPM45486.1 Uncharacterised protein [Orientia tsutsugamushi]